MQTQQLNRIAESTSTSNRSQNQSPFAQITEARTRHRKIRIAIPLPRRESCLTKRAMLAALREAEFAEWMNSGGDFLDSMHQPIA